MSKLSLEIKTATWGRETHGLFDYENSSSSKSKLLITENSWILRNTESVSSYPMNSSTQILDNNVFLGTVKFEGSACIFNRSSEERSAIDKTNCDKVWLVVKSLDRGYRISTGDVIRLGRVHMRVSELGGIREAEPYSPNAVKCKKLGDGGLNKNSKLSSKKDPLHVGMCDTDTEEEGSGKQPCRICLSEVSDDSDPLISPCKCTGTMGRVHLKCLQQWFNSKISARERMNAMSFSWKALECELCKLPYPEKIELNGICHHLIEIPKPEGSYIILEALGKDKNTKTYHVISLLNKNYVRLGRGHDSDVRFFDDISVSRNHAFLKIIQGGLYLMDNQSKFGTLVLVKRPIVIDYGTKLCIQTGRTYLELAMKKQNNWFGCFGCSKVKERKLKRENTQREEI